MSQTTSYDIPTFVTVADLLKVTGDVPNERIRLQPAPGTATEKDVVRINESKTGLCELVDGVLVEKTVGYYEAYLAARLVHMLSSFVDRHDLGVVQGADGMMRLKPGLIRIPDVSFTTWEQIESIEAAARQMAALPLAPDLAVEVLSPSNTEREMDRKLREYFEHGSRQVWILEPRQKEMTIHTSPDECTVVDKHGVVTGGDVLPGFEFPLAELFVNDKRLGQTAQDDKT